ncbi:Arginine--tRNA ligase [uncultured archaeon]|nr:Arginine--tRNA ligase [uncultured archaeon]
MKRALEEVVRALREAGYDVREDEVGLSARADVAASFAFRLSKELKKPPQDIADEAAKKVNPAGFVASVHAEGGYVNFTLNYPVFAKAVLKDVKVRGLEYGRPLVDSEERVVLEHTSVNPSGPVHVGRLRNSVIGDSLRRVLSYSGFRVETRYYVNDVGKQMALIALAKKEEIAPDADLIKKYEKYAGKEDFKTFFQYVAANRKFEADPEFAKHVQELIQKAEAGDGKALSAITNVAHTCLEGQKKSFNRMGFVFDAFDFESQYLTSGAVKEVLDKVKTTRFAAENETGFGVDLSEFGIEKGGGLTVLARKDGTSVYLARDIAYHQFKKTRGDRIINVLGEDHKLEFKELTTILKEVFDFTTPMEVVHFSFVNFEGTGLSTRRGEIASVDQLLDEADAKAADEIGKRGIGNVDDASLIGVGAVKYHLVRQNPNKPISFKWDEALSFDGDSAPYIQYACARSRRILEKADVRQNMDYDALSYDLTQQEKELIKQLSLFPMEVASAAEKRRPDLVAQYAYRLASLYSRFYKECPVLDAAPDVRERRLLTVEAVLTVLTAALDLLGIAAPQKM